MLRIMRILFIPGPGSADEQGDNGEEDEGTVILKKQLIHAPHLDEEEGGDGEEDEWTVVLQNLDQLVHASFCVHSGCCLQTQTYVLRHQSVVLPPSLQVKGR